MLTVSSTKELNNEDRSSSTTTISELVKMPCQKVESSLTDFYWNLCCGISENTQSIVFRDVNFLTQVLCNKMIRMTGTEETKSALLNSLIAQQNSHCKMALLSL